MLSNISHIYRSFIIINILHIKYLNLIGIDFIMYLFFSHSYQISFHYLTFAYLYKNMIYSFIVVVYDFDFDNHFTLNIMIHHYNTHHYYLMVNNYSYYLISHILIVKYISLSMLEKIYFGSAFLSMKSKDLIFINFKYNYYFLILWY